MISVEVRSSGTKEYGFRSPSPIDAEDPIVPGGYTWERWARWVARKLPRDGVAIIIRRET